ncbi:response regulator [Phormidium tenue FACHB-886]|nr:response regulator [Phormidium tenue FACHB-886]
MTKILLVEDNDINRDMLSRRLERQGYEVIIAVNGSEGVAKTLSDRPDLVLMDLHLPILNGWEATRKIKANPQTRVIPVIALTADAIVGEREKALAAGCDEYDTKPVNFPRLLEKIAMLLKPAASQPEPQLPEALLPSDQRTQRLLRSRLRRELEPPIHSIIGYSDMLLNALNEQQNLTSDLQKIHNSGMQLLRLIHAILNPVLVEIQQQDIDLLARSVRLELLTPLSTIIGYCEMLLEESPANLIPDLEQIHTSAQNLLDQVNRLDGLVKQHLQLIRTTNIHEPSAAEQLLESRTTNALRQHTLPGTHRSPVEQDSRILVIDDNASNNKLLSRQLERQGYQVTIANTDQEALQAIATASYDLILLDLCLPNSLKLLEQLKGHGEWRHIPVLIMTALDEMELVVQSVAIGAADYLTRPFQSVLLHAKVTDCLQRKRLQDQSGNFSELWENAPIGVYQATMEGRFRGANSTLVRLLGYPAAVTLMEAIVDIGDQIYVDPNRYTEFKRLLEQNDQVTGFEYQAYRHDGDLIWVSEHTRAVRDANGQLAYYEGIVEDITQRKLVEIALNQQLEALQRELEQIKYAQQASEIVQTDYFQQLQPNGETQQEVHLPATSPPKVLLVEDNELNCDMLSRRLQRYGYQVVIASDGADGVSKALSEQPQVILMDISLPVMDGWEATQQLKDNFQTCRIPVIALTAHAMTGDREKALAAGCDDYDTKPIDLPRLLSKIEECLKRAAIN